MQHSVGLKGFQTIPLLHIPYLISVFLQLLGSDAGESTPVAGPLGCGAIVKDTLHICVPATIAEMIC